jgi:hypothetical protein
MAHPRRGLLAVLAAALLLTLTAGPTAAQVGHGPSFSPIVGQIDGRTGAQLFADSVTIDYVGPALDPAGPCPRLGRHDHVVWLTSSIPTCRLRPGEPAGVFIGAACSDVEEPPFFAVGEVAQRACAREFNAGIASITVAVDDGAPVEVTRRAFAVSPGQRRIVIPADNPAGLPAGPATVTSDGWAAAVRSFTPGTHTVHVVGRFVGVDEPILEDVTLLVSRH